jgi:hypothetical protein
MSKTVHKIFISILITITLGTFLILFYRGISFYRLNLEVRFYNPDYNLLKPSGELGHGMGIIGSLFMIFGMVSYMARKRYRFLSRMGLLKHWLEFHIFLCTLGPILILFHTSYKFGGLVAISFWSMVAVFLSGIIGRFIYIQIPRNFEGRELSLNEVRDMKSDVAGVIQNSNSLDEDSFKTIAELINKKVELYFSNPIVRYIKKKSGDRKSLQTVKSLLKNKKLPKVEYNRIVALVKNNINLNRKIERLDSMQNLFKYWHVAHLPFALVMLLIMIIHVAVTIAFGYKWIF